MYRVVGAAFAIALFSVVSRAQAQCTYIVNDSGNDPLGPQGLSTTPLPPGLPSTWCGVCETGNGNGICSLRAAMEVSDGASGCMGQLKHIIVDVDTVNVGPVGASGDTAYPMNASYYDGNYLVEPALGRTRFTIVSTSYQRAFSLFDREAYFRNMTVRGFYGGIPGGGMILKNDSAITCDGCVFENNRATNGGAVFVENGRFVTLGSEFRSNQAMSAEGGAVSIQSGLYFAFRTLFDGNTAFTTGGAVGQEYIGTYSSQASIFNSLMINNSARIAGGAYFSNTSSYSAIRFSTIANNRVEGPVALYSFNGGATSATGPIGGGIFAASSGQLSIGNSIVTNNVRIIGATSASEDCAETEPVGQVVGVTKNIMTARGNCATQASVQEVMQAFQPYDSVGGRLSLFPGPAIDGAEDNMGSDSCIYSAPLAGYGPTGQTGDISPNAPDRVLATRPVGSACDLGAFEYQGADVGLSLTPPATWSLGEAAVFTLSISQNGPEMGHAGTVTLSVSGGAVINSVAGVVCTGIGTSTATCTAPASATPLAAQVTITAITTGDVAVGAVLNSYSDTNATNNSTSVTKSVTEAVEPAFTCDHIVDSITGEDDDDYKVRLRIRNESGQAATASTASIEWNTNLSFVSADSRCNFDAPNKRITCSGGALANDASTTFAITVKPTAIGAPSVLETCALTFTSRTVTKTNQFGIDVVAAPEVTPPTVGSGGGGETTTDGQNVDRSGDLSVKNQGFRCSGGGDASFLVVIAAVLLLRRRRAAWLVLILAAVSSEASAQCRFVVGNGGDAPSATCASSATCTLRAAVVETSACIQTMGPTGYIDVDVDTITLIGPSGSAMLLNDNLASNSFTIIAPTGARSGFTIQSNHADLRVWNQARGETWVQDATIRNMRTVDEGAVLKLTGGKFTCERCILDNNESVSVGGAFSAGSGYLFLIDSLFTNNRSTTSSGGAVFLRDSGLFVLRSVFDGNESEFLGGAISQPSSGYVSGELTVHNSLFINNRARTAGGAIYQHSTSGGGLYFTTIANNTVAGPPFFLTHGYGGGGPPGVTGPTGGGLYRGFPTGGTYTLQGTILANNQTIVAGVTSNNDCGAIDGISALGDNIMSEPGTCVGPVFLRKATPSFQPYDTTKHRLGLFPGEGVNQGASGCDAAVTLATASSSNGVVLPQPQTRFVESPDQRHDPRPVGSACELGAFEYQGTDVALSFTASSDPWPPGTTKSFLLAMTHNGPEMAHTGTIVFSTIGNAVVETVAGLVCSGLGTSNASCNKPASSSTGFADVTLTSSAPGTITLVAALQNYGDLNPPNDTTSITRFTAAAAPDLTCDHIVDSITGSVADAYDLHLRIINDTGANASSSLATMEWTDNLTFVGADPRCAFDALKNRIACDGGALANGATVTFAVTVQPTLVGQTEVFQNCSLTVPAGSATSTSQFAIEVIAAAAELPSGMGATTGSTDEGQDVDRSGSLGLANQKGRGGGGCRGSSSASAALGLLWFLRRRKSSRR